MELPANVQKEIAAAMEQSRKKEIPANAFTVKQYHEKRIAQSKELDIDPPSYRQAKRELDRLVQKAGWKKLQHSDTAPFYYWAEA